MMRNKQIIIFVLAAFFIGVALGCMITVNQLMNHARDLEIFEDQEKPAEIPRIERDIELPAEVQEI